MERRVRYAKVEIEPAPARSVNRCSLQRASAGATLSRPARTAKKKADCAGSTCAKGSFSVDCGMGCICNLTHRVIGWLQDGPFDQRVRIWITTRRCRSNHNRKCTSRFHDTHSSSHIHNHLLDSDMENSLDLSGYAGWLKGMRTCFFLLPRKIKVRELRGLVP